MRAHGDQRTVNVEQLGALVFPCFSNDQGLDQEWIYQMGKAIRKRGHFGGIAIGPDKINAKQLDKALCLIGVVNDDDRIEASSPKRMGKAKNLSQRLEVAATNGAT